MDQLHSHIPAALLACQLRARQKLSAKEPADEYLGDITSENEKKILSLFISS